LLHQIGDLFELNVKLRCQKLMALIYECGLVVGVSVENEVEVGYHQNYYKSFPNYATVSKMLAIVIQR
jgi:hypothetical protein